MNVLPSEHFTPVDLMKVFNVAREDLNDPLRSPSDNLYGFGQQSFSGIPFELGQPNTNNVLLLTSYPMEVELGEAKATYLIFLHVACDYGGPNPEEFGATKPEFGGNFLGNPISEYVLVYSDGTTSSTPILRRFAIQQCRIRWGASPFEAVPAHKHRVFPTASEAHVLGEVSKQPWGDGEGRTLSARDGAMEHLWLYALENPFPQKAIRVLSLIPKAERSVIYAISLTRMESHPLRPALRQRFLLKLPPGVELNRLGELEGIDLDLGYVISARPSLNYDQTKWLSRSSNVQPSASSDTVLVEHAAHPLAKLYLNRSDGDGSTLRDVYDLSIPNHAIKPVSATKQTVKIKVIEKGSTQSVPVRLHLHDDVGEYLPPHGYQRKVNQFFLEDFYAEYKNGHNQYSYIPGECMVDLPLGKVFVEISRGYEVAPFRQIIQISPETEEISFELDRTLDWRKAGWVTADTHVHVLSPQTALLEGKAEGVNVVNLLATQWGERFTNVGDFDGRTTLGAKEFGGDGEFMLRVGSENRMQVMGHISLLGYEGPMIHPLTTGGPSESAIGDAQDATLAEWAQRCIEQNGLVVMPHAPDPQAERAADIVLGLVHAIEMMTFNPFDRQIRPEGLVDWYRYLNLGYQLPLVGGSDKMTAASLLGGLRTYTQLGERLFTYENWKDAVRAGNTFITIGPLVEISVEGQPPGSTLRLPKSGGTLSVDWKVESVSCPTTTLEIVVGGQTIEDFSIGNREGSEFRTRGSLEVKVMNSTWVAARVRGGYPGSLGDVAAHTSAVQVILDDRPPWSETDAKAVLAQIVGTLTYVDRLSPRPKPERFEQLREVLVNAHSLMHEKIQLMSHTHRPRN